MLSGSQTRERAARAWTGVVPALSLLLGAVSLVLTYAIFNQTERSHLNDRFEAITNRLTALEENTKNIKESTARVELLVLSSQPRKQ